MRALAPEVRVFCSIEACRAEALFVGGDFSFRGSQISGWDFYFDCSPKIDHTKIVILSGIPRREGSMQLTLINLVIPTAAGAEATATEESAFDADCKLS
jgi:hypothetical protein